jgi:hypothetical protein
LDGLGFRYSKRTKSLTWRWTSWSKKIGCLAQVIYSLNWTILEDVKIFYFQLPYQGYAIKERWASRTEWFHLLAHAEENPYNHPPNIMTAEVIDVRNEAKTEGLVHKFKPAKKICEERILKLQVNWRFLYKI